MDANGSIAVATTNGRPDRPDAPTSPAGGACAGGSSITLLRREQGATLAMMVAATGWQTHSTRAVLTGLRKKGHTLVKDKRDDVTCYSIGTPA